MGKYLNLETDVFSIFSSAAWTAENIKTFPANFVAVNSGNEFIRVSVIPSGRGINIRSLSGVLIIDIFTASGQGPKRTSIISDLLDVYLVGKSLNTSGNSATQFQNSSLSINGVDKDNPSLFRATYTIPFNYFGVQ